MIGSAVVGYADKTGMSQVDSFSPLSEPRFSWRRMCGWAMLAIVIRLIVFAFGPASDFPRAMQPDSFRYQHLAENLLEHRTFGLVELEMGPTYGPIESRKAARGETIPVDAHGLHPELVRTPGYPLFIASVLWIGFGPGTVLILQGLLGGSVVMLAYRLAWRLSSCRIAADVAALLLALHPADVLACNQLLSDGLFSLLVFVAIIWLMVARPSWFMAVGVGLSLGAASLVRPMGLAFGPLVAITAAMFWPKNKRQVLMALMLAIVSLIPPGLWISRNHAISGRWTLSTIGPVVAYTKTAAFMRMQQQNRHVYPDDWLAQLPVLMAELDQQIRPDETVEQAMERLAVQEIRRSPGLYFRLLGRSMVKTMTDHSMPAMSPLLGLDYRPTGLGDWFAGRAERGAIGRAWMQGTFWAAILWTLGNWLLAILMPLGWWRCWRSGHRMEGMLMAASTGYFLLATQLVGLERMRLPFLGLQTVAAAIAVGWGWQRFSVGKR